MKILLLTMLLFVNVSYSQTTTQSTTGGTVYDKELSVFYSAGEKKGGNYGVYYTKLIMPAMVGGKSSNVIVLHRYIFTFPVNVNKLNSQQIAKLAEIKKSHESAFKGTKDCFTEATLVGHASPRPGSNDELAKTRAKEVYNQIKATIPLSEYTGMSDKFPVDNNFKLVTIEALNAFDETKKNKSLDNSQRVELTIPDAGFKQVLSGLPISFKLNSADLNGFSANKENLDLLNYAIRKCESTLTKIVLKGFAANSDPVYINNSSCSSYSDPTTNSECTNITSSLSNSGISCNSTTIRILNQGGTISLSAGSLSGATFTANTTLTRNCVKFNVSLDTYYKFLSFVDYGNYVIQGTPGNGTCRILMANANAASSIPSGTMSGCTTAVESLTRIDYTSSTEDQALYIFPFTRQSLSESRAKSVLNYMKASTLLPDTIKTKIEAVGKGVADQGGMRVEMELKF
jgi:hypothetical protein